MEDAFSSGVVTPTGMSPPSEPAPALPPPGSDAGDPLDLDLPTESDLLMQKYLAIDPPVVDFASSNVAFTEKEEKSSSGSRIAASRSKSAPDAADANALTPKVSRNEVVERSVSSERKQESAAVVAEVDVGLIDLPEFDYDYDAGYDGSKLQRAMQIAEAKIVAALMSAGSTAAAGSTSPAKSTAGELQGSQGDTATAASTAGRLVDELSEKARILERQCRTLEHKWQEGEAALSENKKMVESMRNQLHMHKEALAIARTKAQEGAATVDMLKGELKKAVTAIRAQQEKLRQYEQRQAVPQSSS